MVHRIHLAPRKTNKDSKDGVQAIRVVRQISRTVGLEALKGPCNSLIALQGTDVVPEGSLEGFAVGIGGVIGVLVTDSANIISEVRLTNIRGACVCKEDSSS
jgi:hypothetical protein